MSKWGDMKGKSFADIVRGNNDTANTDDAKLGNRKSGIGTKSTGGSDSSSSPPSPSPNREDSSNAQAVIDNAAPRVRPQVSTGDHDGVDYAEENQRMVDLALSPRRSAMFPSLQTGKPSR